MNGKQKDLKNEMYLRYKKSSIFTDLNEKIPSQITSKVNDKKYKGIFEPKYNEKNAREQYMNQFWQKDPKNFSSQRTNEKLNKSLYIKRGLNANEIMCRDMYSNCNPKEYQLRRSKSSFLKRSNQFLDPLTSINTIKNVNTNGIEMNSKERFVDSMQSNIFFSTERKRIEKEIKSNKDKDESNHIRISILPQDNPLLKAKPPKSRISHSKFTTNCDWKYVNTEIASERLSLNVNKSIGNNNMHHKKNTMKGNGINQRRLSYLAPKKDNYVNLNSVQYDIITNQEVGIASRNCINKQNGKGKVTNGPLVLRQSKTVTANNSKSRTFNNSFIGNNSYSRDTEEYQIEVPKDFDKINLKDIKNMFYSEGIHLYRCETKGNNFSNKSGKILFKIRRDKNDKEYSTKIEKINNKITNNQMALNKTMKRTVKPM